MRIRGEFTGTSGPILTLLETWRNRSWGVQFDALRPPLFQSANVPDMMQSGHNVSRRARPETAPGVGEAVSG